MRACRRHGTLWRGCAWAAGQEGECVLWWWWWCGGGSGGGGGLHGRTRPQWSSMEVQHTEARAKSTRSSSNSGMLSCCNTFYMGFILFVLFIYFFIYSLVPASKWNWLLSLPELAGHLKERNRSEQSDDGMRLMVESCLTMSVIRLADQSRADLGPARPHSDSHHCPSIFISFLSWRAPQLFPFRHLPLQLRYLSDGFFVRCDWEMIDDDVSFFVSLKAEWLGYVSEIKTKENVMI